MKIVKPAIVVATLLAAGSALAGEGHPRMMWPGAEQADQGTQAVRSTNAQQSAQGKQASTQTQGYNPKDDVSIVDSENAGAYSNN